MYFLIHQWDLENRFKVQLFSNSFITDALELIVELWQFSNDKAVRSQATLLTRNLCFYGPTKTLLASNGTTERYTMVLCHFVPATENFLTLLQFGLRSHEVEDVAMVSSAVWALLSGCRKVSISTDDVTYYMVLVTCHF